MSPKRIALFLDGTWNEPTDNTNVWRLKSLMAREDSQGVPQLSYYDAGVGTAWYDHLSGGALGIGLSENIRQAYQWLVESYDPGDEVYVFGFSRGAYTARSLVGMIARCGLLAPGAPMPVLQVFERYRRGSDATPLYTLEYEKRNGRTDFDLEESWLLSYATRIPIKMVGVWDTVGALGGPLARIPKLRDRMLYFHNTRLSTIIERALQALALDEHRRPYRPALWTRFVPDNESEEEKAQREGREPHVEQRWFLGAHSNVGGGYRNDSLAQIPLAWIQEEAEKSGLAFRRRVALSGEEYQAPIVDSYRAFLAGTYRWATLNRRFHRVIGRSPEKKARGTVETVNETIDSSVFARWRDPALGYRSQSLLAWAEASGQDLDQCAATTPVR